MKKKLINIGLWTLAVVLLIVLMSLARSTQEEILVSDPVVNVLGKNKFIDEHDVMDKLSDIGYNFTGQKIADIDVQKIEQNIQGMSTVKSANAYMNVDGEINIDVQQRKPICRVWLKNNKGYYIDEDGNVMALSEKFSAHVPIVTSFYGLYPKRRNVLSEDYLDSTLLDEVFLVTKQIADNEFFRNQIQQVDINEKRQFVMIPRVGMHKLLLGSSENLDKKFKKLYQFYHGGLDVNDWNKYDTINLVFDKQVVCSKR